jgi:hypothetical protein
MPLSWACECGERSKDAGDALDGERSVGPMRGVALVVANGAVDVHFFGALSLIEAEIAMFALRKSPLPHLLSLLRLVFSSLAGSARETY